MINYENDGTNNVFIYDRKRVELSGIYDVVGFTDTTVIATCKSGNVSVDGSELKIDSFDSSSGKLSVHGNVNGVFYYGGVEKEKKNKKKKLFG